MAFPTGYTKYQNVTIDNTKVAATLTDFPVFIDLSGLVKTGAGLFDTCRSDGGDIRATLADGTTELAREVVSINTAAKTGELHVKVPSLAGSTDTVIRIWYNGNDTEPAASATYGSQNVWKSAYKLVCHMNDLTTSTVKDSTANGYNGTKTAANTPSELAGKIGKAQLVNPTDEYISFSSSVITQATFAIQFWEYSVGTTNQGYFLSDSGDATNLFIRRFGTGGVSYSYGVGDQIHSSAGPDVARQIWHKSLISHASGSAAWTLDGNTSLGTLAKSNFTALNSALYIGNRSTLDRDFYGLIDELRVLNEIPSADWELTEYNNQSSPSTFYSVSDEQATGAALLPISCSWKILADSSVSISWKLFNLKDQAASWKIFKELIQGSAWKILKTGTADFAWKLLCDISQATAWKMLKESSQTTSWKLIKRLERDSAWAIINRMYQDVAWQLLTSGELTRSIGWKVFNAKDLVIGWQIQTVADQAAAWKVINEQAQATAWNVLRITDQILAYKIFAALENNVAWSVDSESIPQPVMEFFQQKRDFIFNAAKRTFIFYQKEK